MYMNECGHKELNFRLSLLQFWWKHTIINAQWYSHILSAFCLIFADLYTLGAMVMLHRDLIEGLLNMMKHLLSWFVNKKAVYMINQKCFMVNLYICQNFI